MEIIGLMPVVAMILLGQGVAEEAPGAYKDVSAVVDASDGAGLAYKVARLVPVICIKG